MDKHTDRKEAPTMKFEYKTVDTSTLEGLKKAERLHMAGWKIISTGLFLIQFERKVDCSTHTEYGRHKSDSLCPKAENEVA